MKHYMPDFYKQFKCTADKCPDTCCKDWEIVIDEDTENFYKSVSGKFGDMLRSNIVTDGDGDRIFLLNEKKYCPFLDNDKLCSIQKKFGKTGLCQTCRDYPKLTLDFTEFTEYALSFGCPEAVRIIMQSERYYIPDIEYVENDNNGYSNAVMNFLIAARKNTIEIFLSHLSFDQKLCMALLYTQYVQELLYNDNINISLLCDVKFELTQCEGGSKDFVFDLISKFDIMDGEFRADIERSRYCKTQTDEVNDEEFSKLAVYYLHRYYLNAIACDDALSCVKSIYCAYVIISSLTAYYKAEDNFDKRVMIMEKYSREIEHSYENAEMMEEAFKTLPDFSSNNLINTLIDAKQVIKFTI